MFKRTHHQQIATLLQALDGDLLRELQCFFAGGTVIALRYGEYRESVDVDFLVSNIDCYRDLRQRLREHNSLVPILRNGQHGITLDRDIRTDQYGIRAMVSVLGTLIKFEIVLEGRITLEAAGPEDIVCGISTLTPVDMAACKLLANSDRGLDTSVFSRDIIDLAMMQLPLPILRRAVSKAEHAYGKAVLADLEKSINHLAANPLFLDRCMQAMAINVPKAVLWQNIRKLKQVLPV